MAKVKKAQDGVFAKPMKFKTTNYGVVKGKAKSPDGSYKTKVTSIPTEEGNVTYIGKKRTLKGVLKGADKKPTLAKIKEDKEGRVTSVERYRSGGKQMLKRKDGSVSQRGLWDNIRAAAKKNKAAGKPGKKPTAAMLKQERKIKAKSK